MFTCRTPGEHETSHCRFNLLLRDLKSRRQHQFLKIQQMMRVWHCIARGGDSDVSLLDTVRCSATGKYESSLNGQLEMAAFI